MIDLLAPEYEVSTLTPEEQIAWGKLWRSRTGKSPITPYSTIREVKQTLDEWQLPSEIWEYARQRGMSEQEFDIAYPTFLGHYHGKTNRQGELILGDFWRAKYWAWRWFRENGFTSVGHSSEHQYPGFQHGARIRTGQRLLVFTNEQR